MPVFRHETCLNPYLISLMIKMKTAIASASVLTSAALVLPALAQSVQYDADAEVDVGAETAEDQATTGTATGTSSAVLEAELDGEADVGAETAEDNGATGTGGTIPDELPDTGGGWGAHQR